MAWKAAFAALRRLWFLVDCQARIYEIMQRILMLGNAGNLAI
jgi:hypothetical protein